MPRSSRRLQPNRPEKGKDSPFITEAKARFKLATDAASKQREREREDLRFYALDMWPADVRASRAGQNASNGLPPVPARPCLTIDTVRKPVDMIVNQERASDIGFELVPADDWGGIAEPVDDNEIEIREGLTRRIQRESESGDARSWAFQRAVISGSGCYGVLTRYAEGKTWDQEIYVHRFYDQSSVTLDPFHEQPDGSDAEYAFIGVDMPFDQYKAEYPKDAKGKDNSVCAMTDDEWKTQAEQTPEWFTFDGEARTVRVVEYYYTERTSRELCKLEDGSSAWGDELPEGATVLDRRTVVEKSIKWAKIDGCQVLEQTDWPSPYIPIVKVLGNEIQPYDKERRSEGVIRPVRDPAMGINFMVSKSVENIGLSVITPLMVADGQTEGFEAFWNAYNTRTLPYLPYNNRDANGDMVGSPKSAPRDAQIQPTMAATQMFNEMVQNSIGASDPTLGIVDKSVRSGKLADSLIAQANKGNANYMDNLVRSVRHEGRIINSLLYPIYGTTPGRIARIINGENDAETVMIGQPFVTQNNRPQPAQPQMDPATGQPMMGPNGQPMMPPGAKTYTLTENARFNVVVKVAKSEGTRRDQEAQITGEMLQANPQLITWFGDLFFGAQDGPGAKQMAERAKVMLAPPIQQMIEAKKSGGAPPSPEMQAQQMQMQQMGQQMQEMGQALQMAQSGMAEKQLEAQTKMQIAQLEAENKLQIETLKAQVALEKAKMEREMAELRQIHEDSRHGQTMASEQQAQMMRANVEAEAELREDQRRYQELLAQQQSTGSETI